METGFLLIFLSANVVGVMAGMIMKSRRVPVAGLVPGMGIIGILSLAVGIVALFRVHPLVLLASGFGLIGIVLTLVVQALAAFGVDRFMRSRESQ
jgi:hypothetical protein